MTPDMRALAEQAAQCAGWRWLPGMRAVYSDGAWYRLTEGDAAYGIPVKYRPPNPRGAKPDLTDPATVGCLLALVREAWGDDGAHVWCDHRTGEWQWMANGQAGSVHARHDGYPTEAHAATAALRTKTTKSED